MHFFKIIWQCVLYLKIKTTLRFNLHTVHRNSKREYNSMRINATAIISTCFYQLKFTCFKMWFSVHTSYVEP